MNYVVPMVLGLLMSAEAVACRTLSTEDQRVRDREDRNEQRSIVRELTIEADAIYVAKAIRAVWGSTDGDFEILEVLKGAPPPNAIVQFPIPGEITVGCTHSAGFRNIVPVTAQTYVLYVKSRALTKAGSIEREWPDISLREERRLIHKVLASN